MTILIYQQCRESATCKSLECSTFLRVHPPADAFGSRSQTREVVVDSWKGRLYAKMGCYYFYCWSVHRWFVCKSWLVLMCQLNRPSNRFYASLATRMVPLPWIKTVCFSENCTIADGSKFCTHLLFNLSTVKSLPTNYFCPQRSLPFALLQHSSMPADNQQGGHGALWSHCFPEGIVKTVSPNHPML